MNFHHQVASPLICCTCRLIKLLMLNLRLSVVLTKPAIGLDDGCVTTPLSQGNVLTVKTALAACTQIPCKRTAHWMSACL